VDDGLAENGLEAAFAGVELSGGRQFAPTHPHPKAAGSPAALLLTGPFAAMLDRVRDAITG
jgi:hypothetical protein